MKIIATDGNPCRPIDVTAAVLTAGERIDVIINTSADRQSGSKYFVEILLKITNQ